MGLLRPIRPLNFNYIMTSIPPPPPPDSKIPASFPIESKPEVSEEKKPETLFIRCSVVVIYIFLAASVLNLIVCVALLLDAEWGLLGGRMVSLPVFRNLRWYGIPLPYVWFILLQLAWWMFQIFCYICGKYDQVADKYYELEWIGMPWGGLISYTFHRFNIMPFQVGFLGLAPFGGLFLLAKGGVWMWHLIF
jgi:hypothetical protein